VIHLFNGGRISRLSIVVRAWLENASTEKDAPLRTDTVRKTNGSRPEAGFVATGKGKSSERTWEIGLSIVVSGLMRSKPLSSQTGLHSYQADVNRDCQPQYAENLNNEIRPLRPDDECSQPYRVGTAKITYSCPQCHVAPHLDGTALEALGRAHAA
jgi:hypothetical protein